MIAEHLHYHSFLQIGIPPFKMSNKSTIFANEMENPIQKGTLETHRGRRLFTITVWIDVMYEKKQIRHRR